VGTCRIDQNLFRERMLVDQFFEYALGGR
jgi:hypothetical protein